MAAVKGRISVKSGWWMVGSYFLTPIRSATSLLQTVEVSMAEPAPEKDRNSPDLAMTLDDGHDRVTCHGSKSALKKSASAPVVEGKAWVHRVFERKRRPTVCGGFRFART